MLEFDFALCSVTFRYAFLIDGSEDLEKEDDRRKSKTGVERGGVNVGCFFSKIDEGRKNGEREKKMSGQLDKSKRSAG